MTVDTGTDLDQLVDLTLEVPCQWTVNGGQDECNDPADWLLEIRHQVAGGQLCATINLCDFHLQKTLRISLIHCVRHLMPVRLDPRPL